MMRARTMMSALLALTLVAGMVTAPPAFAEDPPIVGELPGDDDGEPGDSENEDEAEDDGNPDGEGGEGDASDDDGPGFGILGDPVDPDSTNPTTLPFLGPLTRHFDFAEPRALYAAESFPEIADGSPAVPAQERPVSVRSVITADLDHGNGTDVASLVYIKSKAEVSSSLRAPGRAFIVPRDLSIPEADPAKVGWYVVIHLHDGSGLANGVAYPVGTEDADELGSLAVGDIDRDGDIDVVFTNAGQAEVITLLNDGDGAFPLSVTSQVPVDNGSVGDDDGSPYPLDRGIAVGDVNRDGVPDLVGLSHGEDHNSNAVVIMSGGDNGSFVPAAVLAFTRPANVLLLDADGDEHLEIVTTSFDAHTPAALWRWSDPGEGKSWGAGWAIDGSALPQISATGAWVGTFDSGASTDIALLSNECSGPAAVTCLIPLTNDGSGKFTAGASVAVPDVSPWGDGFEWDSYPQIVGTSADLDGDTQLDIAIPGSDGEVGLVFGNGSGGFGSLQMVSGAAGWEPDIEDGWDGERPSGSSYGWPADWGTMLQTTAVAVADVSGDSSADLVVGTSTMRLGGVGDGAGQLAVVTATSPGRFAAATAHSVTDRQWGPDFRDDQTAITDWNGDGKPDLVFLTRSADGASSDVMLAAGNGSGFAAAAKIGTAPADCAEEYSSRVMVADVTGDGQLDLVCGASSLHVLAGSGGGALGDVRTVGLLGGVGGRVLALAAEDLDGDEKVDIVYAASTPVSSVDSDPATIVFGWAKNKGDGTYSTPVGLVTSGFDGSSDHYTHFQLPILPVIADLTGNGRVDFAVAGHQTSSAGSFELLVYVREGAADEVAYRAVDPQTIHVDIEAMSIASLEAADLDGTGASHLILTAVNPNSNQMSVTRLLLGDGDGTFTAGQTFPFGPGWPGRQIVDLNADGKPDLVTPTAFRGMELRPGLGGGAFGPPEVFGIPGFAIGWVRVADMNGDGHPDIIGAIRTGVEWRTDEDPAALNQLVVMINGGESVGGASTTDLSAVGLTWQSQAGFPTGAAGDPFTGVVPGTVALTVRNSGDTSITRTWSDSVWLASGATWESRQSLLFSQGRTGLAAGASLADPKEQKLAPPILASDGPGEFYLIARVDARHEIAESTEGDGDNLAVAGPFYFEPTHLDLPTGASPADTHVTVASQGSVVHIPPVPDAGAIRLTVTGAQLAGFAVREGKLPTDAGADQRVIGEGGVTLLPGAERYVLLDLPGGSATVTASLLPFGLGSVSPRLASTAGVVTFTVTGSGLGLATRAWAIAPDGAEIPATSLIRQDPEDDFHLSMTFDLRGQQAGVYGLRVSDGTTAHDATLADAFTAVSDRIGTVRTAVLIPSTLRRGSVGHVWVTYANDGLTDAVAPILRIRTRGVVAPADSTYPMGTFYVSPEVAGVPAGVIPPGTTGRIRVPFMVLGEGETGPDDLPSSWAPEDGRYGFYVEEYGIDSIAPYDAVQDFAAEVVAELPGDANQVLRDAVLAELGARLGDTGGSYLAALHELRRGLTDPVTADMDGLRQLALDHALDRIASTADVRGSLTDASGPVAFRWMNVVVDDVEARVRTDEAGSWSLPGVTADAGAVVNVYADGYGPAPVHTVALGSGNIDVTLPGWGALAGTVTDETGASVAGATVIVADATNQAVRVTTGTGGTYRFDGIAAGSYTVTAIDTEGGIAAAEWTMGAPDAVFNLVFRDLLAPAAAPTVVGSVPAHGFTDLPADVVVPTEVTVWVADSDGVRPLTVESDGSFAATGAAGSAATLWIFDPFLGVRSAEVTFPGVADPPTEFDGWAAGGSDLRIPITLPVDDELPRVYLQLRDDPGAVPMTGIGPGMLLIPSGLSGDPVTWTGDTTAGAEGTLRVRDVPAGNYWVVVTYPDGTEDIAAVAVSAGDVDAVFRARTATAVAGGTATRGGEPLAGGYVSLTSTNLTPARSYVTAIGDPETDPSSTAGAWNIIVEAGEYDVTYYDASGTLVATGHYPGALPLRTAGRAFIAAPAAAPATLGASYLALPPLRMDGDFDGDGGAVESVYREKFWPKSAPARDGQVGQAIAKPYPTQPPPDECKELDVRYLDIAKTAAQKAESTRLLIENLVSDTRKTTGLLIGEAAARAVVFLGEIANLALGVLAIKQAVGKAAATAAAREEAKAMAAKGLKPPTVGGGVIDLSLAKTLADIQTIMTLGSTIYTETKAAIYSAGPGGASAVINKVGQIGALVVSLSKELGYLAASTAVVAARELIGPISAINNMITQVYEAGDSYRSAMAQLDTMKSALDQLYVSYDFDLGNAHAAWHDFLLAGFPEVALEGCDDDDDDDDDNGGGGGNDDDDDGPKGPKPGPKPPRGDEGEPLVSRDPNDISGPLGVGAERWVQPGTVLAYRIGFENIGPGSVNEDGLPQATAPAAAVTVRFPLPAAADLDTVELGEFGFGEVLSAVHPGVGERRYLADAAPGTVGFEDAEEVHLTVPSQYGGGSEELTLSLATRAWLDRAERTVNWEISLVDPETGLPDANPQAGFLPPEPIEAPGAGQGWANISFATDVDAPTGTDVAASAEIVFDTNDAIWTNVWSNRLDGTAPASTVSGAATTAPGQTVTVGLNDGSGSGAGLVDVWRSVNGSPLKLWKYQVPPGPVTLTGASGQVVGLAARSTDRVGNAEDAPTAVQFTTTLRATPGGDSDLGSGGGSGLGSGSASGGAGIGTLPENAERVAGSNRNGTAAEIAARYGTADAVIVANGEDYKHGFDALAANYLAGQAKAPIVLTRAGVLPAESLAAICSVLRGSTAATRTIYLLGGTDTVSAAVAAQLVRPCSPVLGNVKVVRIGGSDRYETAAMIATRDVGGDAGGDVRAAGIAGAAPRTAILASGLVNADALAAGAVSARFGIPVLLTGPNRLPQATADALKKLRIERVIVLGGQDRVSAAVKAQLTALGIGDVMTIAGKDRFETSALIAAWAMTPVNRGGLGHTGSLIGLANGVTGFPDALAAGPLLGKQGGMLLLTGPGTLPEPLRRFLAGLSEKSLLALGGPTTVADSVILSAAGS